MPNNGELLKVKVKAILNYGAKVKLESGEEGLIHISEISNAYVKDIHQFLHVGEEITVKFMGYNQNNQMSFSVKAVQREEERQENNKINFEKKLKKFMKESSNVQRQIQKNVEQKQGVKRKSKKNKDDSKKEKN